MGKYNIIFNTNTDIHIKTHANYKSKENPLFQVVRKRA